MDASTVPVNPDRRLTKQEFLDVVVEQIDQLFDMSADTDGKVDIVGGLVMLAAVEDESYDGRSETAEMLGIKRLVKFWAEYPIDPLEEAAADEAMLGRLKGD